MNLCGAKSEIMRNYAIWQNDQIFNEKDQESRY